MHNDNDPAQTSKIKICIFYVALEVLKTIISVQFPE